MTELLLLAALAGTGVAFIAGPLGTFVVWRRMAYFGDTLAHSSLLGVALAIGAEIAPGIAITLICLALALFLVALEHQQQLHADTLLGILSHTSLALGMVVMALIPGARVSLESLLFGDLLSVDWQDVALIWGATTVLLLLFWRFWQPLLSITVHEQLAIVEGVPARAMKTLMMLMLALLIAMAIKVVGVLLITALLVIPAATARTFSRSPEAMAALASLIGVTGILGGLVFSWYLDTPVGPAIVLILALCFLATLFIKGSGDS